jgi:hypothetical protein
MLDDDIWMEFASGPALNFSISGLVRRSKVRHQHLIPGRVSDAFIAKAMTSPIEAAEHDDRSCYCSFHDSAIVIELQA